MKAFAELLDRLSYSPSRNAKLRLMVDYFRAVPDPDRGWALAAFTDGLPFSFPLRRTLMDMVGRRMDAELFRLSREYVGDTAETIALVWEATGVPSPIAGERPDGGEPPTSAGLPPTPIPSPKGGGDAGPWPPAHREFLSFLTIPGAERRAPVFPDGGRSAGRR